MITIIITVTDHPVLLALQPRLPDQVQHVSRARALVTRVILDTRHVRGDFLGDILQHLWPRK